VRKTTAALSVAFLCLLFATGAQADRSFEAKFALNGQEGREAPFEDACGVATDSAGDLYVAEYYPDQIDVYAPGFATSPSLITKITHVDPQDGPCSLAVDGAGHIYVNDYHRAILRYTPSSYPPRAATTYGVPTTLDSNEPTGFALDPASGDLYTDNRTYIAHYEAPLSAGEEPAEKIGEETLEDGYGLAFGEGRLYVPDAGSGTVKVYEPSTEPVNPVAQIGGPSGGFTSLLDSTLAIDPTDGNLLVAENTQPGFEAPAAAIEEFSPSGEYLGALSKPIVDSGPIGLSLTAKGSLYVTSGNDTGSALYAFGPSLSSPFALPASPAGGGQAPASALARGVGQGGEEADPPGPLPASASEIKQQGTIRAAFSGQLSPHALPRSGTAPVHASVGTKITTTNGQDPPQLRQMKIAINANGRFEPKGLPICPLEEIQPSTTQAALGACRSSLVGEGLFEAKVLLSHQSPFPSQGKVYAFNSVIDGHPAILAHVYGTKPVPTSFTLPFILHKSKGTFGTTLIASLPEATGNSAYVTGISLNLFRRFSYQGHQRSYISAGCPAPKGFSQASFPFARATLSFRGGKKVSQTLERSCGVRG
jgi:DNA-binding beta-propeller fold protein YncE